MTDAEPESSQNATAMPPPDSPARSSSPRRAARHAKGLSLNFPILLPTSDPSQTSSPLTASPSLPSARASPRSKTVSFHDDTEALRSPNSNATDFLTLVAAQERKVLEIREELSKAEAELNTLKKQWAVHEANKKREEVKQVRRVPVSLDDVSHSPKQDQEDLEEERRRRRALVEMKNMNKQSAAKSGLGRKGSQRKVFEGKHARTLSLLSPIAPHKSQELPDAAAEPSEQSSLRSSEDSQATPQQLPDRKPSLSRMPTLDGLISPDALQMGSSFGKTYKDLAAQHRRSLPPAAVDMMKQGKYVVEGVRDGLWTFFEDIRQATVGEEAINGASVEQQQRMNGHNNRPSKSKSKSGNKFAAQGKEDSFWREFGLDTPGKAHDKESRSGHVQQKSKDSTDSQNPPDLLDDVQDHDEEWDNWESPSPVLNKRDAKVDVLSSSADQTDLPWPALQKLTPSKLNRTGSDLIREWGQEDEDTVVASKPVAAQSTT
jgi:hypothetical protein